MKFGMVITHALMMSIAITNPITNMALQDEMVQRAFKYGFHRKSPNRNIRTALTFSELFDQLNKAQEAVANQRRKFAEMMKITNGYKQ